MKPFWDEYIPEFDDWCDSDILNGGIFGNDQERLTQLCNDVAIGRHPDLFSWPTQMIVPHWCIKDYWTLTLN